MAYPPKQYLNTAAPAAQRLDVVASELAKALEDARPVDAQLLRSDLIDLIDSEPDLGDPFVTAQVVGTDALPTTAGVYMISAADKHYVGLALNVHHRFHNPMYGHLTEGNHCRSRPLVDRGGLTVRILEELDSTSGQIRVDLAASEISAYARLRARGFDVVNSLATLGRVGESSSAPAVLCRLSDGEYLYCDSYTLAGSLLGRTSLSTVLFGYQRTVAGYAARWASPAEVEALSDLVPTSGVLDGESVNVIVTSSTRTVAWVGQGRNASFSWGAGPLLESDRASLVA